MSHKILDGLNDALAFARGDSERGRLTTIMVPAAPLPRAIQTLQARGIAVEPSDIPGLFFVGGRELTIRQVIDVASKA